MSDGLDKEMFPDSSIPDLEPRSPAEHAFLDAYMKASFGEEWEDRLADQIEAQSEELAETDWDKLTGLLEESKGMFNDGLAKALENIDVSSPGRDPVLDHVKGRLETAGKAIDAADKEAVSYGEDMHETAKAFSKENVADASKSLETSSKEIVASRIVTNREAGESVKTANDLFEQNKGRAREIYGKLADRLESIHKASVKALQNIHNRAVESIRKIPDMIRDAASKTRDAAYNGLINATSAVMTAGQLSERKAVEISESVKETSYQVKETTVRGAEDFRNGVANKSYEAQAKVAKFVTNAARGAYEGSVRSAEARSNLSTHIRQKVANLVSGYGDMTPEVKAAEPKLNALGKLYSSIYDRALQFEEKTLADLSVSLNRDVGTREARIGTSGKMNRDALNSVIARRDAATSQHRNVVNEINEHRQSAEKYGAR